MEASIINAKCRGIITNNGGSPAVVFEGDSPNGAIRASAPVPGENCAMKRGIRAGIVVDGIEERGIHDDTRDPLKADLISISSDLCWECYHSQIGACPLAALQE